MKVEILEGTLYDMRVALRGNFEDGTTYVEAWPIKYPGCIVQRPTFEEAFADLDILEPLFVAKLKELGYEIEEH